MQGKKIFFAQRSASFSVRHPVTDFPVKFFCRAAGGDPV